MSKGSAQHSAANPKTAELLKNLEARLERTRGSITLHGYAVSKDEESIHLSTPSGLMMIPIAEIVNVMAPTSDERVLVIEVRNSGKIEMVDSEGGSRPKPTSGGMTSIGFSSGTIDCTHTPTWEHSPKTGMEHVDNNDHWCTND